ncbi:transcription factor HY5 [Raphanus sativus]|uniref:Transcription factor HY5 n=1 Tax=Raphanus sativus TaxID=3726 RepID=A0A6J0JWC6_RAPSA|nr:transcription factor HY5 [Raphanus sativus]
MTTERFSDSVLRLHVKQDSDNEIGEIHDLDAGEQSLTGSEGVKLLGQGQRRRRGKEPAERESSRLKRLLRNRVSAQRARERKKVYVNELEKKVNDLEAKNTELEERLSTLQKENHMLRHIIKNTSSSSSSR